MGQLVNVSISRALTIIHSFGGTARPQKRHIRPKIRELKVKLPYKCGVMGPPHRKYLKGRGYDPGHLEDVWGLQGTTGLGPYKWRIVAPIYYKGQLVSYQCRDISDKHALKYMACPQAEEAQDHQTLVYGFDQVPGDTVVIVEGIADVWRLGPGAVATYGIDWTPAQANILRGFKNRLVFYDANETPAAASAERLAGYLSGFRGSTEVLELEGASDPGAMDQEDADGIMKEIMEIA